MNTSKGRRDFSVLFFFFCSQSTSTLYKKGTAQPKRSCRRNVRKNCHKMSFNFVLHTSPITFFGEGLSGPLSRCPDVKYNHPSQYPTSVVFTRNGSFPITDHCCNTNFNKNVTQLNQPDTPLLWIFAIIQHNNSANKEGVVSLFKMKTIKLY